MTRRGILTGGTWCIDRNLLLNLWPADNGRADILETAVAGGGSGCNLAVDIRKLDPAVPVATIALVGDDADGRFLAKLAEAAGIEHSRMQRTDKAETAYTLAFASAATGQRTHISQYGANHVMTPDHFDFTGLDHRIFHLGLPGVHRLMDSPWGDDANGWVATLRKARAAGMITNMELASISPARNAELVRPCLPQLDLLIVNDTEIGGIAGMVTVTAGKTDVEACVAAAKAVLQMGAADIVVAHFPGGAVAATRDGGVLRKPSVRIPQEAIAGANGAGDAFAAGFLYGFHEGWDLAATLAMAHATAAASLRQISTSGAVEGWQACLALADGWGWREAL